jgi:ribonuclease-3
MRRPRSCCDSSRPKTSLQELAGQQGLASPVYELTESGPDHQKLFVATVRVSNATGVVVVKASGQGPSKKQAEASAARDAVAALSALPPAEAVSA